MNKSTVAAISAFLIVCLMAYGGWKLKRWWNFKFGYQSQAVQLLCDHIKPEAFIDPSLCE